MKTKKKMTSKLWYLGLILIFALGCVAGSIVTGMAAEPAFTVVEPAQDDKPVVTGDSAELEQVEDTEEIKEAVEVIEEVAEDLPDEPVEEPEKEKECTPDPDGFKRCEWPPEYADFPYSIPERDSPRDWIKEYQISMAPRSVTIQVQGAILAAFADTNSMDPLFDAGSNAIEVVPKSPNELQVGDIVSYETEYGTIIHRIIETGHDEEGWYAIFQGDNNPIPDPEKIRFDQIRRVIVAIIY